MWREVLNTTKNAKCFLLNQKLAKKLDGFFVMFIESSDDDKIVQYKWEEVKGPLNDKNKMMSSGVDTPVLQLKSLVPGIYTFKYAACFSCFSNCRKP